jgi:hypothetical protein
VVVLGSIKISYELALGRVSHIPIQKRGFIGPVIMWYNKVKSRLVDLEEVSYGKRHDQAAYGSRFRFY